MRKLFFWSAVFSLIANFIGYLYSSLYLDQCYLCGLECYFKIAGLSFLLFSIVQFVLVIFYFDIKGNFLTNFINKLFNPNDLEKIGGVIKSITPWVNILENNNVKFFSTILTTILLLAGLNWGFKPLNCFSYCEFGYSLNLVYTTDLIRERPLKMTKGANGSVLKLSYKEDKNNKKIKGDIWIKKNAEAGQVYINDISYQMTPDWEKHVIVEETWSLSYQTLDRFLQDWVQLSKRE